MRKSSWLMILVALLTITAPTAFADSLSIVFSVVAGTNFTPVDTSISVPSAGVLNLGTVSIDGSTFTFQGTLVTNTTPQMDQYGWVVSGPSSFLISDSNTGASAVAFLTSGPFTAEVGAFGTATVLSNVVATPEPSPVVLALIGMGLLAVMRKR